MLSQGGPKQYLSEAFHTMSQPLTGLQCGLELAVAIPRGPEGIGDESAKRLKLHRDCGA